MSILRNKKLSSFLKKFQRDQVGPTSAPITKEKQYKPYSSRDERLFIDDATVISKSEYPTEYAGDHIPFADPEVTVSKSRRIMGNFYRHFKEMYNGHRRFVVFNKMNPEDTISQGNFIAPNATIVGDVAMGEGASVWYNVVIRGDKNAIVISNEANIQDGTIITTEEGQDGNVFIGDNATIGHDAKLHGCFVGAHSVIGIGAIVLEGAIINDGAIVASGAVVPAGRIVGAGELWAGNPARFLRKMDETEKEQFMLNSMNYVKLSRKHELEFTEKASYTMYKEVENMVKDVEKRAPVTDDRFVQFGVYDKMNKHVPFLYRHGTPKE